MIVFVPAYDEATQGNLAVANLLDLAGCEVLVASDATRASLHRVMAGSRRPLFLMSHGGPESVMAQDRELAIGLGDCAALGDRHAFVFACHTAAGLGPASARLGAIWWGYTGAIVPPSLDDSVVHVFARLFETIRTRFAVASSRSDRAQLIAVIKSECDAASATLDEVGEVGFDVYACVLHIWQRLRVWVPGSEEPERHPEAPKPIIMMAL